LRLFYSRRLIKRNKRFDKDIHFGYYYEIMCADLNNLIYQSFIIKNLKVTFRSFRHRNYRLFFGGQSISLIGTWLQQIAMSWLVYRLTNSAFLLGVVSFSGLFPIFLCTPFAGVLSDRLNNRHILITTQTLAMIQAFILSILVLTNSIAVWHIIALSIFMGIINGFDMPTRQAFVVQLVENREDLSNAIALNSATFNGARFIGPSIGGILIALVGEGLCFLLNGISYIAVIIALIMITTSPPKYNPNQKKFFAGLKEGFKFAFGYLPIRVIMLFIALISITAMPYTVVMPIFAKDILRGGSHTLGFLMTAAGAGALLGALYLASRKTVQGLERIIPIAAAVFGVGLILFSFSRYLWLSLILLFFIGMGMMIQIASSNTILQTIVDDEKRGRVMSIYTMSFIGLAPFGSLLAGSVADWIGVQTTVMIGGFCCLAGAIIVGTKYSRLIPTSIAKYEHSKQI
jgi:MFS family permease